MKVYILIEQVFPTCEDSYTEVLGVYKNAQQAEEEKQKVIQENIENYNFVKDSENMKNIFATYRLFLEFQENWDYYIEYKIIEKEVL